MYNMKIEFQNLLKQEKMKYLIVYFAFILLSELFHLLVQLITMANQVTNEVMAIHWAVILVY